MQLLLTVSVLMFQQFYYQNIFNCIIFGGAVGIVLAPYGIREPTERVGTHKVPQITEQQAPTHIPSKIDYGHDHLYQDLLNFAARHLKLGGRLVTFIPILR